MRAATSVNRTPRSRVVPVMPEFATLAPPYSMPAASHGDVDLSDSSSNDRCRALSQFLAGVEVRAYSDRPAEEWKPLFYRILENRIRDMQRRRTVRNRVMSWLPFRSEAEED